MEKLPLNAFLAIFDEMYVGTNGKASWVIDREPGYGFLDTIRNISAEDASKALHQSGSTIAAHTEHLRWSLSFALSFFQGKQPDGEWNKSWRIKTVTAEEWENLQSALQNEYIAVREAINEVTNWDNPLFLTGTLALLPHAAYHLGSIKQMALMLKV